MQLLFGEPAMKKEYDLKSMKSRPNPFASKLKKAISIRLGVDVIEYFKQVSNETGVPYQTLIDTYLRDCMLSKRKPKMVWS